jgi:hypothetical protein
MGLLWNILQTVGSLLARAKGGPRSKARMSVARIMGIYGLKRPDISLFLLYNLALHEGNLHAKKP